MSVLINGTNGLIQAYDYQALTTGFSYTFSAGTQTLIINPATTLAAGTITMPASPSDGMTITFSSTKQITALTLNGNTGQTVVSAVTFLPANQATTYIYRATNTTWYPMATVPTNVPVTPVGGSILTFGTVQASTSGTSIEFTGIPSWAKRVTVLLQGVSTNGANPFLLQLGTSGGYVISGYTSGMGYRSGETTSTFGFLLGTAAAAGNNITGVIPIVTYTTNAWVSSGTISRSDGFAYGVGGSITSLGGTLDRLRIISSATANPADTFDLGSINILYE